MLKIIHSDKKFQLLTSFALWCLTLPLSEAASTNPTNELPSASALLTTGSSLTGNPADVQDSEWHSINEVQLENKDSQHSWWSTSENASGERLRSQTQLLLGVGLVAVGVLYCMPEDVTNWDDDHRIEDLPERWWKNVSRRPVWDKDDWFINYVGHTYCGGVYYQMARKSGYNQWDSFLYTTAMSTFFWEYGIEAFAERPSIQDLVVTPLGGWLYGECAFRCEQRIEENDQRLLGSKTLGHISLFLLDPIDHLGQGVNWLFGSDWVLTGRVVTGRLTSTPQGYADETEYTIANSHTITPGFRMALERPF